MLSWIARLAARYDLAACDFLAWLNGDQAVDVWRMQRLDWVAYDALDRRLAFAAGIDLSQVETLRVPPSVGPEIEKWTRGFGV